MWKVESRKPPPAVEQNGTRGREPVNMSISVDPPLEREVEHSTPLVIVCGWFKAQDKHVAKYSYELNHMGCVTLRSTLPPVAAFSPFAQGRKQHTRQIVAAAKNTISKYYPPNATPPVHFMCFSNGGAWVWMTLTQMIMAGEIEPVPNVRGVVFDSAPCYMWASTGARALSTGLGFPLKQTVAGMFLLFVCLGNIIARITGTTHRTFPMVFWRTLTEAPSKDMRELYLFSDDDPLCDASKVNELVGDRSARGVNVSLRRWKNSRHCGHMLLYRDEYLRTLEEFLFERKGRL